MLLLRRFALVASPVVLIVLLAGIALHRPAAWEPAAVALAVCIAIGLGAVERLRGYQFTMWIIAAVTAGMVYPGAFQVWGGVELRNKWVMLLVIQMVMFGMGTQMSLHDFAGVAKTPRGVLVGIICHFSVMPLVGLGLTRLFAFPPEIAAGIILIGSCSSGLASNVMAYLARANLVLSVTVTAITTMVAPFLTPLWMKLLAGQLVPVSFFGMMMEIIKFVIVPIGAALLHDYLKSASPRAMRTVLTMSVASIAWLVILALGGWKWLDAHLPVPALRTVGILGFFLSAIPAGLAYHMIATRHPAVARWMPAASMFGIVYFTTVTTAAGRDNLLKIGPLLFLASIIHNAAGYFFGYWLSRGAGLDKNSARSVAFEVGLQNGGMATGLANSMGKLGTVGLAAAIFSPWMNISGSILANYWRRKPVSDEQAPS
jgi:bile acid:Na+ symporter, BASS family